jgi:hypothetical protein|tara:strand:+ start:470 stop:1453 length:984 start_codon:yes stop_codon:yes gene_type:complete
MARDYTKYNLEGLGENFNKRKLVYEVIKDWTSKNKSSFEELQKVFPDEIQGTKGLIMKESEVKDPKRFNMKEPLSINNGMHVVVSNQWGENIADFIVASEKLGYRISKIEIAKAEKLINLNEFDPFRLNKQFKTYLDDNDICARLDEELESLIDKDPKFMSYAKIFELASGFLFDYYREDVDTYFTISDDKNTLLDELQEQSLISRILKKHKLKASDVTSTNIDFKLLFTAYFCFAINKLVDLDDEEVLAEFIFAQSCSEEEGIEIEDDGDWLSDLTIDILNYIYDKNVSSDDYEDGCTLHGSYFGDYNDLGYDYVKVSRELIDSMI